MAAITINGYLHNICKISATKYRLQELRDTIAASFALANRVLVLGCGTLSRLTKQNERKT